MEQRALLLRRLAFVIFCSDVDQYQKQMPDIQGKNRILKRQSDVIVRPLRGDSRFRAHGGEPADDPLFGRGARGRVSLLSRRARPHVCRPRDLHVAAHHNRDGSNIL